MTKARHALPGFGPTLGLTVLYLSLLVLIPLCGVFIKTATLTPGQFWDIVTTPRALASYRLTFSASAVAASLNVVFGVLVRYPGAG
jgi:sulfate transport system permease protein